MKKCFLSFLMLSLTTCYSYTFASETDVVKMKTNQGDIFIELDAEHAPKTVENFLRYVKEGFYTGTIFHRVIDNFMIQGGGFTSDYEQKTTHDPILNEANNGLKNKRGTIAMARTSDPHSATAQFFINVYDNFFLDYTEPTQIGWGYAVFGEVIKGMDVVDNIKGVKTGQGGAFTEDVPLTPIVIEEVSIEAPIEAPIEVPIEFPIHDTCQNVISDKCYYVPSIEPGVNEVQIDYYRDSTNGDIWKDKPAWQLSPPSNGVLSSEMWKYGLRSIYLAKYACWDQSVRDWMPNNIAMGIYYCTNPKDRQQTIDFLRAIINKLEAEQAQVSNQ